MSFCGVCGQERRPEFILTGRKLDLWTNWTRYSDEGPEL